MPVAVAVFAAVDQGLSDAIAKAIAAPPVKPLVIAPASSVVPLKMNIGQQTVAIA
jgi:catalase